MAPHHSHCLAGLIPSMSPPPLGERSGNSRWTYSHVDSHTMGDHEPEIQEIPDLPPHIWDSGGVLLSFDWTVT